MHILRDKWYSAKNYIRWATFLSQRVSVYLQPLYTMRPESYRIRWITQSRGYYAFKAIQGHQFWYQSKAHIRLPISGYFFLLPILHRFRDIAYDTSKIAMFGYPSCVPQMEGFPWDDLRKIFCGCQRISKVPTDVETLPKNSTAWVGRTNVTDDRQTERRQTTDGRTTTYSELILWQFFICSH